MPATLHDLTVKTYLQILPAVGGLIDKAEAHCRDNGLGDEALLKARLSPDMWPFGKQIMQIIAHSQGAMNGLAAGQFSPDMTPPPEDFGSLRNSVRQAIDHLAALDPAQVNALEDGDMAFLFGDYRAPFTPLDYALSFALPNFYFHVTIAYGILRNQGLSVGKMDFMGEMRIKA